MTRLQKVSKGNIHPPLIHGIDFFNARELVTTALHSSLFIAPHRKNICDYEKMITAQGIQVDQPKNFFSWEDLGLEGILDINQLFLKFMDMSLGIRKPKADNVVIKLAQSSINPYDPVPFRIRSAHDEAIMLYFPAGSHDKTMRIWRKQRLDFLTKI